MRCRPGTREWTVGETFRVSLPKDPTRKRFVLKMTSECRGQCSDTRTDKGVFHKTGPSLPCLRISRDLGFTVRIVNRVSPKVNTLLKKSQDCYLQPQEIKQTTITDKINIKPQKTKKGVPYFYGRGILGLYRTPTPTHRKQQTRLILITCQVETINIRTTWVTDGRLT